MEGHQSRLRQAKRSQEVSTTSPGKTKSRAEIELNLRHNYCKIVLLIMEIASAVIRKYITEQILNGNTFQSFLNERTIKHALFHSVYRNPCCECSSEVNISNNAIKHPGNKKLWKLYIPNPKNIDENHIKYNECLCKYAANQTEIEVLDITMANCLINVISTTRGIYTISSACERNVLQWITQIVKIRNEILHLSELRNLNFETNWYIIDESIMGLANAVGKDNDNTYAQLVNLQIKDLNNSFFKDVNASENGKLCIDYCNTKFDEFEKNQDADSNRCKTLKLKVLHEKLTTTNMDKINNYLQTLETKIDNTDIEIKVFGRSNLDQPNEGDDIDVYIPVLLHLKLPPGWNIHQIEDAVKKMKLQGTSDMPIQIKSISKDLTIVADVSSSSLKDNQELSSKIKQVISSIMSDTGINTQASAVVGIELDIPNNKVEDNTNLHFENVDENTFQPLENVEDNTNLHFENVDENTFQPLENVEDNTNLHFENVDENTFQPLENVEDNTNLHFENVDENTFQPLENVEDNTNLPFENVDENTFQPLENVSEQTDKGEPLQIEVALPDVNIRRTRRISDVNEFSNPHLVQTIVDCILINRNIVLIDYANSKLLIHNIDGHNNNTIQLYGQPRCISIIRDDQIAVSYIKPIALARGKVGNIDIIDINKGLENSIENIWEVGCMTYQDGLLFVVIDGRKVALMNLAGTIEWWFKCPSLNISNISSDKDLLYLTDSGTNSLFCCDVFGELKWKFKDDCLRMPSSVTVDPYHNVYVTGHRSKNIVKVSPDGRKLTELLPEPIGVKFPLIIHYDKANDYLLAFNYLRGDAFLLDIKTKPCDDNVLQNRNSNLEMCVISRSFHQIHHYDIFK